MRKEKEYITLQQFIIDKYYEWMNKTNQIQDDPYRFIGFLEENNLINNRQLKKIIPENIELIYIDLT